jgi:hypothetical protein
VKKESSAKRHSLFFWVGLAFAVQIAAWCVFLWFAHKSQPDEVPLMHAEKPIP